MRPTPEGLAAIPLFAALSADQLKGLASFTTLREEPAGAVIAEEGTPGFALFVIAEGTALATSNGRELAALGPGDFFGEIAVLGDGWRTATVTATSPVGVIVMLGRDFRVFARELPEVCAHMQDTMVARLERSSAQR
jgi:CRP/FNR family cyclic AMP-dependent transcriptional regulator